MKLIDILPQLFEGKKIRRKSWIEKEPHRFWWYSNRLDVMFPEFRTQGGARILLSAEMFSWTDWELYEEFKKPMNFIEALQEMKNGKKIKRQLWTESYIYLDEPFIFTNYKQRFHISIEAVEATDWVILE